MFFLFHAWRGERGEARGEAWRGVARRGEAWRGVARRGEGRERRGELSGEKEWRETRRVERDSESGERLGEWRETRRVERDSARSEEILEWRDSESGERQ